MCGSLCIVCGSLILARCLLFVVLYVVCCLLIKACCALRVVNRRLFPVVRCSLSDVFVVRRVLLVVC